MSEIRVINDCGNYQTKQFVNGALIKQPSVIYQEQRRPQILEKDLKKNMANLWDKLTVHITSNSIKRNGIFYVGNKALSIAANKAKNMNIANGNKHENDIPLVMTLSITAARLVEAFYEEHNELPQNLEENLILTSSIPASEYSPDHAEVLEKRFLEGKHIIIIYIGDQTVTVQLNVSRAKVTMEGLTSLYAILESDQSILDIYLNEYEEINKKRLEQKQEPYKLLKTPKDLKNKNVFHVEIGDGTTEYIYTKGLNPELESCTGEKRGVGHAKEIAAKRLAEEELAGALSLNRQQFTDILMDKSHTHNSIAVDLLDESAAIQADFILEDIETKYREHTYGNVDFIVCYGGGSIALMTYLYKDVLKFCEKVRCQLLWIPEEHAVDLNARGLQILNEKILFKKKGVK